MTFHHRSKPLWQHGKRTVVMNEIDASGAVTQRDRPAARVLIKDPSAKSFESVCTIDEARFALATYDRAEIRSLPDGALIDPLPGCITPVERCGSRLLADGAYTGGYAASTRVIDLESGKLEVELPVAHPRARSAAGLLFGRIRAHYGFGSPIIEPARAAPFPELKQIIDASGGVLVACDLAGKVAFTIAEKRLAEPYAELTGLVLSRDERTLYYAGQQSVGAIDVERREIRWLKHFGHHQGEHYVWHRRIALSADERRIAVGGMSGSKEPSLRVLAAADGEVLQERSPGGRVDALMFHGEVLLAATNGGWVHAFDRSGQERSSKVSTAGINDMAVIGGGLLLACAQHQVRFFPLLDDE